MAAGRVPTSDDRVCLFADLVDCLAELFRVFDRGSARVIGGGYPTPEVALAADRAGVALSLTPGKSPFSADTEAILAEVKTGGEIICLANPGRVTGACFGLADLRSLVEAVPGGALIVDEYFFDFYGITGLSLHDDYDNVIVLRSLTGSFGIGSDHSGFVVADPMVINWLTEALTPNRLTLTERRILTATLTSNDAMATRLKSIHDEALRLGKELTRIGVQPRLTATDFILLRVAVPRSFVGYMAGCRVPFDNLGDYDGLEGWVRYRIQSPVSNDNMLEACRRMPSEYYRLADADKRSARLVHGAERALNRESSLHQEI
jgi:histidinol-phosphate aminotransferase